MPYSAVITHDIDYITKYKSIRNIFGAIKRGNNFYNVFKNYLESKKNRKNDPYYCMQEMLELNNTFNLPTIFYFMSGKTNSEYDLNDYNVNDPDIKNTISDLMKSGATIGIHPSYESFNNLEIISDEKKQLEDSIGKEVIHSRQHYLRYNQDTFKLLAKAGIKYDSTIGPNNTIEYNDNFNEEYTVYQDETNSLIEQPFLMMDTHLISKPKQLLHKLNLAVSELKQNEGTARIIWHNNHFESSEQKNLYKEVLAIIAP